MKKIIIVTSNSASIKNAVQGMCASLLEIKELSINLLTNIEMMDFSNSLLIYEIQPSSINWLLSRISELHRVGTNVFCIATNWDESLKQVLIEHGICDLTSCKDPQYVSRCIGTIYFNPQHKINGTVYLLSNDDPFSRIVSHIAQRFFYKINRLHTIAELIALVEKEIPTMMIVDMDTDGFTSVEFIKKTLYAPSFKKSPLIIYKDMRKGLSVDDLPSGIRRLTQAILSREELLNLLLILFFQSEIDSPCSTILPFWMQTASRNIPPLRQIFFEKGLELCFKTDTFLSRNFEQLQRATNSLCDLLYRAEPLRWLIYPLEKKATCAMDV
ncbi:MAG: hypothetical protein N2316_08490 [Spirochaetes bacterium]|nr:hypothetical protein [Spirochaetota bacterium]